MTSTSETVSASRPAYGRKSARMRLPKSGMRGALAISSRAAEASRLGPLAIRMLTHAG